MSPKIIIKSNPSFTLLRPSEPHLDVSEFFCDTIQGEGINIGMPATFLRVQHCTLTCTWCDTQSVWHEGNPYTFTNIFELIEDFEVQKKLYQGQHLVFTGGSPLKQQDRIIAFVNAFVDEFGFKPHIEIENECTIMPLGGLVDIVDTWNNSPKLMNSGNLDIVRYQPAVLSYLSTLDNSWFKFVVEGLVSEWEEIFNKYLLPGYIKPQQIILMPMGGSRAELEKNREIVVQMAIKNNVRYTSREHVVLWDKMTGV